MIKKVNCLVLVAAVIGAGCSSRSEPELLSGVDIDALDRSTRPQDDFYQFVNGGWLDGTEIPEIYSGYTVYHEVNERVEIALREIIETAADAPGEKGSESQQVGDIYGSWMDIERINAEGIAPVQGVLDLVAAVDSVNSLVGAMAELSRLGVMVPYAHYIEPDREDSSSNTLYFYQRGITMPNRDYYLQPDNANFTKARSELAPYIAKLLARSGLDESAANAAAERVFDLETAIATAQWDSVSRRDPQKTYNPYSLEGLGALGDSLDWELTLRKLGVESQGQIVLEQPSYFEALDALLSTIPLATWKNYLTFRVMDSRALHLDEATAAIRFDYRYRVLRGQKEWFMTPQTVNAYYDQSKNEIVFPAARLQPPFFQLNADDAINYGAVGGVIGHEISHGFDDQGSQFDGDGNLVNWWTEEDRAAFDERTKVLVEQFNAFEPVEGMHINGELTLGENIGDLSGVAMAYRARASIRKPGL